MSKVVAAHLELVRALLCCLPMSLRRDHTSRASVT